MKKKRKTESRRIMEGLKMLPKNWFNPDPDDIEKIIKANRAAEESKFSKYRIKAGLLPT